MQINLDINGKPFYQMKLKSRISLTWQWKFKRGVCVSPPKGLDFSFQSEFFQFKDELVRSLSWRRGVDLLFQLNDGVKIPPSLRSTLMGFNFYFSILPGTVRRQNKGVSIECFASVKKR
jgi:hypothetical protein